MDVHTCKRFKVVTNHNEKGLKLHGNITKKLDHINFAKIINDTMILRIYEFKPPNQNVRAIKESVLYKHCLKGNMLGCGIALKKDHDKLHFYYCILNGKFPHGTYKFIDSVNTCPVPIRLCIPVHVHLEMYITNKFTCCGSIFQFNSKRPNTNVFCNGCGEFLQNFDCLDLIFNNSKLERLTFGEFLNELCLSRSVDVANLCKICISRIKHCKRCIRNDTCKKHSKCPHNGYVFSSPENKNAKRKRNIINVLKTLSRKNDEKLIAEYLGDADANIEDVIKKKKEQKQP